MCVNLFTPQEFLTMTLAAGTINGTIDGFNCYNYKIKL